MEIPLNAPVFCGGERCGQSRYLVISPTDQVITHFVVMTDSLLDPQELLVPLDWIEKTDVSHIYLKHTRAELSKATPLRNLKYLVVWDPVSGVMPGGTILWPYTIIDEEKTTLNIPQGEVLLDRGAEVVTTDGKKVGRVDEFVINPHTEHITHLLLREGHFWNHKELSVPVRAIQKIVKGQVILNVDSAAVDHLMPIPGR